MINLMLQGPSQQSVCLEDERGAVKLRQGRFHIHRSADFAADTLDTEAALEADFLFLTVFERGVDENERHDVTELRVLAIHFQVGNAFGVMGNIDDREPQIAPDLRRGKTHAVRVGHGLKHFRDERDEAVVDGIDVPALLAEDGVAVLDDGEGHGRGKGNGVSHVGSRGNCPPENSKPPLAPLRGGTSFGA